MTPSEEDFIGFRFVARSGIQFRSISPIRLLPLAADEKAFAGKTGRLEEHTRFEQRNATRLFVELKSDPDRRRVT